MKSQNYISNNNKPIVRRCRYFGEHWKRKKANLAVLCPEPVPVYVPVPVLVPGRLNVKVTVPVLLMRYMPVTYNLCPVEGAKKDRRGKSKCSILGI